ncbi:hypothetical protein WK13_34455 [Burkholderia ubonensis]|uniref:ParB N-terminal domain-containing protein n=1 Tax=Burkholderia ubonensis TaxID=101571 RepID=UPI00075631FA|nr:ParB N-terminal domain-containing protein [Burkholderia ubonensis]KVR21642.1 hypothetical protein WK13_34455 [Burkholderia ubonensis]
MKHAHNEIVLRDISTFHGAEYNPRKMIPERLNQVAISLRKLGFLLPIYVNKNGVILSGHQRTTAAKMVGYTKIPVVELDVPDDQEKGLNVLFNKGTNDMDTFATDAKNAFSTYLEKATGLLTDLPDIEPDTYYPCMERMRQISGSEAVQMAGPDVSGNVRSGGYALIDAGVAMPLVACGERLLNGTGRAHGYYGKGYDLVDVVDVPPEAADYAHMALNFLAMDFDIQSHFKEELRFNAFRRKSVQAQIHGLSRTYPYFVYGRIVSNTLNTKQVIDGHINPDLALLPTANEDARVAFKKRYGHVIFDMGAGTLHDTAIMKEAGFDLTPFEPYYSPPGQTDVDPDASRALIDAYLDKLDLLGSCGSGPDSIISSFVLNSVPHHEDRMAYLTILAAMCRYSTGVFIGTQHAKTLAGLKIGNHLRVNNAEPNVTLGNDTRFFKAQKFFEPEELRRILSVFFAKVEIKAVEANCYAECRHARRVPDNLLREAIDLEFDLPYKDGSRMGLAKKARGVFGRYLGRNLT